MLFVPFSLQEKKKDIVAQAMREEKIFEEISRAAQTVAVAIKSEPSSTPSTSSAGLTATPKSDDPKPGPSGLNSGGSAPRPIVSTRGRGVGRPPMQQRQQQMMPR